MGVDDLFGAGEDLIEGEDGGVDEGSVRGGAEGGVGAIAIALIALLEIAEDGGLGLRVGGRGGDGCDRVLLETPVAANFGSGVEEDFDLGIGKDLGADVAAFHDDASGHSESALLGDHPGAEPGVDGDAGGGGGDVGLADAAADVHFVEQDAVAIAIGFEGDGGVVGEIEERGRFVEVEIVLDGLEGEGAVHGSGLEVQEAEATREVGGEGRFTGAGRAIDGDDGPLTFCRLRGAVDAGGGVLGRGRHDGLLCLAFVGSGFAARGTLAPGLVAALELIEGAGTGGVGTAAGAGGFGSEGLFRSEAAARFGAEGFFPGEAASVAFAGEAGASITFAGEAAFATGAALTGPGEGLPWTEGGFRGARKVTTRRTCIAALARGVGARCTRGIEPAEGWTIGASGAGCGRVRVAIAEVAWLAEATFTSGPAGSGVGAWGELAARGADVAGGCVAAEGSSLLIGSGWARGKGPVAGAGGAPIAKAAGLRSRKGFTVTEGGFAAGGEVAAWRAGVDAFAGREVAAGTAFGGGGGCGRGCRRGGHHRSLVCGERRDDPNPGLSYGRGWGGLRRSGLCWRRDACRGDRRSRDGSGG